MQNSVLIHSGQQKDISKLHERIQELEAMLVDDPAPSPPPGTLIIPIPVMLFWLIVLLLFIAGIRVTPRCSWVLRVFLFFPLSLPSFLSLHFFSQAISSCPIFPWVLVAIIETSILRQVWQDRNIQNYGRNLLKPRIRSHSKLFIWIGKVVEFKCITRRPKICGMKTLFKQAPRALSLPFYLSSLYLFPTFLSISFLPDYPFFLDNLFILL